ncbi:MAG: molecular chaperone SurA [Herbaspirillum sp.]|jgi:peptidyl-prolyl cis-trans isomerase SurA|nr:molecular chaperone SurA [Herbaspirillum sp.]
MNVSFFTMRNVAPSLSRIIRTAALLCMSLLAAPGSYAQDAAPSPPPVSAPAAAVPASASASPAISHEPQPVDSIAVVVNNEVITRQEVMERLATVESRMTAQGVALPPRTQLIPQLLERMIVEHAQVQLAKEDGIKVDDAMLDKAIERIAEQNKMTMPQFRAQLVKEGLAFPAFREQIRNEILMQRVREREVDNKIQISDSEIDNYLAAQAKEGPQKEEFDVAQILVRVPDNPTPEQLAERRQRAEQIYQQVRTGGDFGKIAATYSDSSDAMTGGDLGWRTADRLPQLFADTVAKMKAGETAPIVRSANGFHILRLVDRRTTGGAAAVTPGAIQQTHARHILIKVTQVVTAAEAKRKLLELKQRLENHAATFEELAKLYSNDGSASKGGDLGWIYPGDTVPEFERAMNDLKVGEISDPIESPFGFHLIQVLERKSDEMSQDRLRTAARTAIRERKLEEATNEWQRQLRDQAYVEYRLDQN